MLDINHTPMLLRVVAVLTVVVSVLDRAHAGNQWHLRHEALPNYEENLLALYTFQDGQATDAPPQFASNGATRTPSLGDLRVSRALIHWPETEEGIELLSKRQGIRAQSTMDSNVLFKQLGSEFSVELWFTPGVAIDDDPDPYFMIGFNSHPSGAPILEDWTICKPELGAGMTIFMSGTRLIVQLDTCEYSSVNVDPDVLTHCVVSFLGNSQVDSSTVFSTQGSGSLKQTPFNGASTLVLETWVTRPGYPLAIGTPIPLAWRGTLHAVVFHSHTISRNEFLALNSMGKPNSAPIINELSMRVFEDTLTPLNLRCNDEDDNVATGPDLGNLYVIQLASADTISSCTRGYIFLAPNKNCSISWLPPPIVGMCRLPDFSLCLGGRLLLNADLPFTLDRNGTDDSVTSTTRGSSLHFLSAPDNPLSTSLRVQCCDHHDGTTMCGRVVTFLVIVDPVYDPPTPINERIELFAGTTSSLRLRGKIDALVKDVTHATIQRLPRSPSATGPVPEACSGLTLWGTPVNGSETIMLFAGAVVLPNIFVTIQNTSVAGLDVLCSINFTFSVFDGRNESTNGTATLIVRHPLQAAVINVTVNEDVPKLITLSGMDYSGSGHPLRYRIVRHPRLGDVFFPNGAPLPMLPAVLGSDNTMLYTPPRDVYGRSSNNFVEDDFSFSFDVWDSSVITLYSAPRNVTVQIMPTNDAPVLSLLSGRIEAIASASEKNARDNVVSVALDDEKDTFAVAYQRYKVQIECEYPATVTLPDMAILYQDGVEVLAGGGYTDEKLVFEANRAITQEILRTLYFRSPLTISKRVLVAVAVQDLAIRGVASYTTVGAHLFVEGEVVADPAKALEVDSQKKLGAYAILTIVLFAPLLAVIASMCVEWRHEVWKANMAEAAREREMATGGVRA